MTIAFLDILEKIQLESSSHLLFIDTSINIIFVADYIIRLYFAKNKKTFFKSNIPDLIAIIPFNSLFKALRIVKLFRLMKLAKLSKLFRFFALIARLNKKLKAILRSHGLIYSLWAAGFIIFLGAIGIYFVEKGENIKSFQDAIWWAFVTATTVGYGDISPSSPAGRIIAGILMLTGIGTIGMLTSSISVFLIEHGRSSGAVSDVESLSALSSAIQELSSEEASDILKYIEFLKTKR